MKITHFIFAAVSGLLCATMTAAAQSSGASLPNVVIIYMDDLGYGDPSCYGATRRAGRSRN